MFASRRAFAATPRFRAAGGRSIATPLVRFSTEAAAPASETAAAGSTTTTDSPATTSTSTATPRTSSFAAKPKTFAPKAKTPYAPKAAAPSSAAKGLPTGRAIPSALTWKPSAPPPMKQPLNTTVEDINWEKSYYGLGTNPVTPEQFKILTEAIELDDVIVKPDGIIYMTEIKYRRKLNEAFGPMGWGIVPRGEAVVGTGIVTREYALIVNGCFVSQAQGVNNFFGAESIPSAVEGCKSNALMRCCKDLGVSSELWEPRFIRWYTKHFITSEWVENANTKKKRRWYYKRGDDLELPWPYRITSA